MVDHKTDDQVRQEVRERYARFAVEAESCCGPGECSPSVDAQQATEAILNELGETGAFVAAGYDDQGVRRVGRPVLATPELAQPRTISWAPEDVILVLDFVELKHRARTVALFPGFENVGILVMLLQPTLTGFRS